VLQHYTTGPVALCPACQRLTDRAALLNCDVSLDYDEPGSSLSIMSDYGLDDRAIRGSIPAEARGFSFRLALSPTHSPVQWVPGVLSGA
jgi:hypothetical protein